jgi:hypothetical protein
MGMKDNMRTSFCGPSDGLRITPALVADCDTEMKRAGLEYLPALSGNVSLLLGRIDLLLVLPAGHRTIGGDHERADEQSARCHPLGTKHDSDAGVARG